MGKIIGGGLPVGAYGGKKELMDQISPVGPVYQAGTLSGNPLAMAAGIATLRELRKPGFYEALEKKAAAYAAAVADLAAKYSIPSTINRVGSAMTAFFTAEPVVDFESAMKSDSEKYGQHWRNMLEGGIYLAPSQFEAAFVSAAHSSEDLDKGAGGN